MRASPRRRSLPNHTTSTPDSRLDLREADTIRYRRLSTGRGANSTPTLAQNLPVYPGSLHRTEPFQSSELDWLHWSDKTNLELSRGTESGHTDRTGVASDASHDMLRQASICFDKLHLLRPLLDQNEADHDLELIAERHFGCPDAGLERHHTRA